MANEKQADAVVTAAAVAKYVCVEHPLFPRCTRPHAETFQIAIFKQQFFRLHREMNAINCAHFHTAVHSRM